jgi:signal transduction histidine kinase
MKQGKALVEEVPWQEALEGLRATPVFSDAEPCDLGKLSETGTFDHVDRIEARAGALLVEPKDQARFYWVVLAGEIRAEKPEADGSRTMMGMVRAGEGFGESPLLTGKTHFPFFVFASRDSRLIRFSEQQFWTLLAYCPAARRVLLGNVTKRLQAHQAEALHREKLISLGTMAAGLMHELHNPGAAAQRSSAQLRANLLRLQELSLRTSARPRSAPQMECLHSLLERAVRGGRPPALSSVDQLEAEEKMTAWLSEAGVENPFVVGPALVDIGFNRSELECARRLFEGSGFSDALNWLGALVSSVSLVGTIEESIQRISELVMAVKKFGYEERLPCQHVDVHESLQSTLTLLGHKIRLKHIQVEKRFDASTSSLAARGTALSQVWTNLLDNAIDASPENGKIEIATWTEGKNLVVSIMDHGAGIKPEALPHIFEAFYTTKPQGSGTGLGLEIVHRIVTQKFGGRIEVESIAGQTRFLVHLKLETACMETRG